jgi:chromosome segregation protein
VTEEGELLTSGGELTGGARTPLDQGVLHKKREMKDLAEQVTTLHQAVADLQQERGGLQESLADTEQRLRDVEAALHQKDLKVASGEKDLARLQEELARCEERIEVLSLEEAQLHEEQEELQRQLEEAGRGRSAREADKVEAEARVATLQEELQVLRRQAEDVRDEATTLKMEVVSLREREEGTRRGLDRLTRLREEFQGRIALLDSRRQESTAERQRLGEDVERSRAELDILYRKREEEKKRLENIRDQFETTGEGVTAREEELRGLRSRVNQAREELSGMQLRRREVQMEVEHLRETILDRYRVDLETLGLESDEGFDAEGAERRAGELRRLIDDMGEVNLTAIDEFQELEERHTFLTAQQEDLRQSLNGLQTAIAKINRTTRKRFRETFELVNAKFQEVFPRLFRGGRAELQLTDEQDLLETGIEIIVQPPGKKLQSVNLLSGGEKALTAVALIFSIFMIKPSPFCLLDEVDAPLDDANIGRFNDLVREMTDISQFIIITHNKRTMEIADTLYGVTMEEPGVSKLVSVRINEF